MTVEQFGTDEQKEKYIRGWLEGTQIGFFAMTEPDSGSDVASMKTHTKDMGDHWEVHAANECMTIFGSYGFSTEYPAERLYREAKSLQVVEGTSNVQKLIISGMACGHTANR